MLLLGVVTFGLLAAGCQTPSERLNAPPHGPSAHVADLRANFDGMTDNALLEDMAISDLHFVPHRAMLNGLGEQHLCRLAQLMETYGGTLRFNTDLTDDELIEQRTETIMSFLAEVGVDTSAEVLVRDLPGGRGMTATESILIKTNEGTYKPDDSEGGSEPPSAGAGVSQ
jgi:hypothetical protein